MQPLDYTFFMIIGLFVIRETFSIWNKYFRIRLNTKDDLIQRYVKLAKINEYRR